MGKEGGGSGGRREGDPRETTEREQAVVKEGRETGGKVCGVSTVS